MEQLSDKISYHDCVMAYYADLLESREVGEPLTVDDMNTVSLKAAEFYLDETATSAAYELSNSMFHPFGRLWIGGLLDSASYFQWAYAKERTAAARMVATALNRHQR